MQTLGQVGVVTKQALGVVTNQTLGQVGVVIKQTVVMHAQVSVNGKRWIYNTKCLLPASEDEIPEQYGIQFTITLRTEPHYTVYFTVQWGSILRVYA